MPTRRRKRKAKKRKAASRKRARRPVSRTRINTPSSDEDFVLDSDGEESSSGSAEEEDSSVSADDGQQEEEDNDDDEEDEEEEEEEEEKVGPSETNLGFSADIQRRRHANSAPNGLASGSSHPSRSRCRRRRKDSSDEEFNVDAERALDDGGPREQSTPRPSRPRRLRGRENGLAEDFEKNAERPSENNGIGGDGLSTNHTSRLPPRNASVRLNSVGENIDMYAERSLEINAIEERAPRPARARRRRRTRNSSDDDYEMDIARVLENSGSMPNEGAVATRSATRAMDSGQLSHSHAGTVGNIFSDSLQHVATGFVDKPDILLQGTLGSLRAKDPSLQLSNPQVASGTSTKRDSDAGKDAEIEKRKGKEKVLEGGESTAGHADGVETAVVCGICLNETALVERGKLDCCDHFFCFGCIMEWAKVESRCPMCKQRFATIAKSASGISKRARTVRIPLRDQVYIPPEDQDLPPEDPYGDTVCMECHGTGDEGLLLLCDRCDSAAHTFCVGLGRSVPRGDWYCRDCQALIGESSASDDEEWLVSASSDEEEGEDEEEENVSESLLRSIVASVNPESQRRRRTSVQRTSTSTSRSLPVARSRLGAGVRRRLLRWVTSQRRGRPVAAPQLSQSARAFLSSTPSELNQVPQVSEVPPTGSARTVPQQRRLQERINVMRSNWGRIQTGDLQFDAVRTRDTVSIQQAELDSSEPSTQGNRDLERAWQMLGHAQNVSGAIGSSKTHLQKPVVSHQIPSSSSFLRATQSTGNTTSRAINNLPCASRSLDMPTSNVLSSSFENGAGINNSGGSCPLQIISNTKHDGTSLGQGNRPRAPLTSPSESGECRKEELRCSSNAKQTLAAVTFPIDCSGSLGSAGVKQNVPNGQRTTEGSQPELTRSSRHFERSDAGRTRTLTGNTSTTDRPGVSAAAEKAVANSSSSPLHEGLKIHLTELVKKQTWPVYIAERLDKEQFKRIARAAVHSLLALCDTNNESVSLSCGHLEDQGHNPIANFCKKCLDQHVEKAVKVAKDKIVPG